MAWFKIMVGALALALTASAADAQLSPFGGFVPYEVNGPAAGASQFNAERCEPEQRGRGGIRYNCQDQNARPATR